MKIRAELDLTRIMKENKDNGEFSIELNKSLESIRRRVRKKIEAVDGSKVTDEILSNGLIRKSAKIDEGVLIGALKTLKVIIEEGFINKAKGTEIAEEILGNGLLNDPSGILKKEGENVLRALMDKRYFDSKELGEKVTFVIGRLAHEEVV